MESQYQRKVISELESEGYYVLKLIKTNKPGIPDLIALKPNEVKFIEVKGERTPVSELQKYRIKELQKLGFDANIRRKPIR